MWSSAEVRGIPPSTSGFSSHLASLSLSLHWTWAARFPTSYRPKYVSEEPLVWSSEEVRGLPPSRMRRSHGSSQSFVKPLMKRDWTATVKEGKI